MTPEEQRAETVRRLLTADRSNSRNPVLQLLFDYLGALNEDMWLVIGFLLLVPFNFRVAWALGVPAAFSGYDAEWWSLAALICLVSALLTMLLAVTLEMTILLLSAWCLGIDMDQTPTEVVSIVCVARIVAAIVGPVAVAAGLILSGSPWATPLGVAFFGIVAAFVFEIVIFRNALQDMMHLDPHKAALLVTTVVVAKCVLSGVLIGIAVLLAN